MHVTGGKPFLDKKMISPHNEWNIGNVLVCAHLCSNVPIVYALLRSYLDFKG